MNARLMTASEHASRDMAQIKQLKSQLDELETHSQHARDAAARESAALQDQLSRKLAVADEQLEGSHKRIGRLEESLAKAERQVRVDDDDDDDDDDHHHQWVLL